MVEFDVHVEEPLDEDGRSTRVVEQHRDTEDQEGRAEDRIVLLEHLEVAETVVERVERVSGTVDGQLSAARRTLDECRKSSDPQVRVHRRPRVDGVGGDPVRQTDARPAQCAVERQKDRAAQRVEDGMLDGMRLGHQQDHDVQGRIELHSTQHTSGKELEKVDSTVVAWVAHCTRVDEVAGCELGDAVLDALASVHVEHREVTAVQVLRRHVPRRQDLRGREAHRDGRTVGQGEGRRPDRVQRSEHRPHDEDAVDECVVDEDGRERAKASTNRTAQTVVVFEVLATVLQKTVQNPRDCRKHPQSCCPSDDALVNLALLDGRHGATVHQEALGKASKTRQQQWLVGQDPFDGPLQTEKLFLLILVGLYSSGL